ncbi:Pyridine nucleotide-disulfide oxidoreductase, partial [Globisporangium splendens]
MPRIVIIGAGPAGITLAQTLAKDLKSSDNTEVIVLEKSKYYYYTIATPRAYVDESFTKNLFIPYDNAIPKEASGYVKIVHAVVTRILGDSKAVTYRKIGANDEEVVGSDTTLSYDYLVIATGSSYTVPIRQDGNLNSRADTEYKLQEVRQQIEKAQRILIVGGGSVGCEVAGDIASKYPGKSVTILDAADKLVAGSNLRDKFYDKLNASLAKLNVNVILGERLPTRLAGNSFQRQTLVTDKGTHIESDIQLLCGGFSPVAELVQEMDASLVDQRGFIKVNDRFQVASQRYGHVFAVGDASNHPSPKLAFIASQQAQFLAKEFVAVLRKKQKDFTNAFPKVETEAMILPLGPNGGVSQLPVWGGLVFGDFLTRTLKSKDYFAGKMWSTLGLTMPASK